MPGENATVTAPEPFAITHRPADTDGEYVRFEGTLHPSPDAATPEGNLAHERFLLDNPDEHLHPRFEEVIEVLEGEYAVEIEGTEHRLETGETITVPEATPHRHWNPTASPIRVAHEHHPPLDSAAFGEAMYALAQDGKADEKGIPNLLQFAVLNDAYPDIAYTTDVPIPVQKALMAVLAPIGRLMGYEAEYSRNA